MDTQNPAIKEALGICLKTIGLDTIELAPLFKFKILRGVYQEMDRLGMHEEVTKLIKLTGLSPEFRYCRNTIAFLIKEGRFQEVQEYFLDSPYKFSKTTESKSKKQGIKKLQQNTGQEDKEESVENKSLSLSPTSESIIPQRIKILYYSV